jgi:hypothetical protein
MGNEKYYIFSFFNLLHFILHFLLENIIKHEDARRKAKPSTEREAISAGEMCCIGASASSFFYSDRSSCQL